jgi:hypothetical protein
MGRWVLIITTLWCAATAWAEPRTIPYKGRLMTSEGKAVVAPVDLTADFYPTEGNGEGRVGALTKAPLNFKGVPLDDGVFELHIALEEAEYAAVFAGGAAYLQVTDVTHGLTYQRQRLMADAPVPAVATKSDAKTPPVTSVAPSPGDDTVLDAVVAACIGGPAPGAKFVRPAPTASAACSDVCAAAEKETTCVRGWTLFANGRYFDFGNECHRPPGDAGEAPQGRLCCCLTTAGPMNPKPTTSLAH